MATLDRIKELEKQRSRILKQILAVRSMLPGAYREVYCKCGKPNCWCYNKAGHLFRRITWSENGRSNTKVIPEEDINWIKELTENYREFQKKSPKKRLFVPKIENLKFTDQHNFNQGKYLANQ